MIRFALWRSGLRRFSGERATARALNVKVAKGAKFREGRQELRGGWLRVGARGLTGVDSVKDCFGGRRTFGGNLRLYVVAVSVAALVAWSVQAV